MSPDILLVDDDPGAIQLMGRILSGVGHLRFATNGADALRLARALTPDVVLLDAEMPVMSGFEVCAALKDDPGLADVPVIFVTSHRDEAFEVAGFDAGAADFIAKPVSPALMLVRVRAQLRIKRMADELRLNATTDALTGVANRRRFNEALECEWLRALRTREPLSLVMVDVDYFKLFNDRYGHPAGDVCLQSVAQAQVRACRRPGDLVARYGGEEFALLLPQTPAAGAEYVALRVLGAIEALGIPHASSSCASNVTVSAGIACYDQNRGSVLASDDPQSERVLSVGHSAGSLLEAADKALYAAKSTGRAKVFVLEIAGEELFKRGSDAVLVQRPRPGQQSG